MAAGRKTHSVGRMLAKANWQLQKPDFMITLDQKRIICMMIESVLHETGNYEGYGYIDDKTPAMLSPQEYRRTYYIHKRVRSDYEKEYSTLRNY
jgi:hypothetical protein|tara:strand:+ start:657 stop:938 length:282 start_codon:yes stop_codon:yes gene_type:complete